MKILRKVSYLFLATVILAGCGGKSPSDSPAKYLDTLEKTMNRSGDYQRLKRRQIDSLKRVMTKIPVSDFSKRSKIALDIAERFRLFNADSSMFYSEMAYRLVENKGDLGDEARSLLVHTDALSTAGVFTVAQGNLKAIGKWNLPEDIKIKYWESMRILYGYMRDFYERQPDMYAMADRVCEQYDDSLMSALPKSDRYVRFLSGERMMNAGQYDNALLQLESLLGSLDEKDPYYGKTAFLISKIYHAQGDQPHYVEYLAKSATADIKGCVREGSALPTLADWMWTNNNPEKAYNYINFALEEATLGNARMRTYNIASFLPKIDITYHERVAEYHNNLLILVFVSVFLVAVSLILFFVNRRQYSRTRMNEAKLAQTSKMQENYLANFVALSSNYANRFESLTKLVGRKLASGQAEELLKLINSGKLTDSQDEDFHTLFDAAFNDLYPDFTEHLNLLLREDERITLKNQGVLTPELRIYALVRLGIDESTKIAQVLNYSVSTVYAYRNRMRNRAINRTSFDEDVKNIS